MCGKLRLNTLINLILSLTWRHVHKVCGHLSANIEQGTLHRHRRQLVQHIGAVCQGIRCCLFCVFVSHIMLQYRIDQV